MPIFPQAEQDLVAFMNTMHFVCKQYKNNDSRKIFTFSGFVSFDLFYFDWYKNYKLVT